MNVHDDTGSSPLRTPTECSAPDTDRTDADDGDSFGSDMRSVLDRYWRGSASQEEQNAQHQPVSDVRISAAVNKGTDDGHMVNLDETQTLRESGMEWILSMFDEWDATVPMATRKMAALHYLPRTR